MFIVKQKVKKYVKQVKSLKQCSVNQLCFLIEKKTVQKLTTRPNLVNQRF